jgi:hypothetical protein
MEINGLKTRLKETWMAGDYDRFSRYMEQGARIFYEQLDIPPGSSCSMWLAAQVRRQPPLGAWAGRAVTWLQPVPCPVPLASSVRRECRMSRTFSRLSLMGILARPACDPNHRHSDVVLR